MCSTCGKKLSSAAARDAHQKSHSQQRGGPQGGQTNAADGRTRLAKALSGDLQRAGGNTNILRGIVMQALGRSMDSSVYALRYLHPMDEVIHGGTRICDEHTAYTAALEGRSQDTITAPSSLGDGGTWNMNMIVPSIPDIAFLYQTWDASTSAPAADSWTPVFYSSFLAGSVLTDTTTATEPVLSANSTQYRGVYRGITCHLNAAGLNDAGMVYGGQYGGEYARGLIGADVSLTKVRDSYTASNVPITENQLYQMVGATVQQEAREGVYMPLMYNNPAQQFTSVAPPTISGDSAAQAKQFTFFVNGASKPISGPPGGGRGPDGLFSAPINFTTGIIMWRGLYKAASIQVKTRIGIESVPGVDSPWSPFTEASPLYDPAVMTRTSIVRARLPLMFPAHYNDFSDILKTIGEVIMGPVRGIADTIGGMGIPVLSDIAGPIGGVLGGIKNLFNM